MRSRVGRAAVALVVPAVVFGLSKVHAAWVASTPYDFSDSPRVIWASGMVGVIWVASYALGLPSLTSTVRDALVAAFLAVATGVVAVSGAQLVLGDALLPRFVVFGAPVFLIPGLTLAGTLGASGRRASAQNAQVLFVGGDAEAATLTADLAGEVEKPATVVNVLSVAEIANAESPLLPFVEESPANLLVLDVRAQSHPEIISQAAILHERGMRVRTLSLFYEEWLGKLPVSEIERVSLMFDVGEVHRARYARAKRVMDIAAGLAGCLAVLAVMPFVLAGNFLANRGPLIYRQERVGKGGRPFTIYKFRTMRPGSGEGEWTQAEDDRVTPFGRMLRRTHLDELPQAINILRGDLSLVGPRPEQPRYVEQLEGKLPFYRLRHLVRPGLTGWAQVKYGYAADDRDALEKLQYEFYYLRRQSLALDLRIVARTLRHLVGRGGR